ncbi:MAG: hypothetical protein Q8O92_07315 [Candidatus Latescibacter sp.]|nr:hypothetical protein [Candidatus Latescibacter sp.]
MNRNEKIAWYNLAVCMITAMVYIILFLAFEDKIGAARASKAALAAFALLALVAFGKTLFKQRNRSEFITIDDQGTVTHYPYKKFLIAGLILSFVIFFMILFLIIIKVPYNPALMISISMFNAVALSVLTFLYYKLRKRSTFESEPETSELYQQGPDMDERDIVIFNRARNAGIVTFFCFFIFGLIGISLWMQNRIGSTALINFQLIQYLIWPSALVFIVSQSITSIVLYRRGGGPRRKLRS